MPTKTATAAQDVLHTLEGNADEVAALLKALAHPSRLLLAAALARGERSVGELERRLDIHQPSLSQQLGVLRQSSLIDSRRESRQVFYRLTQEKAALLLGELATLFPG